MFAPPSVQRTGRVEFTDANPLPPTGHRSIADFTATIDWGDGTPLDGRHDLASSVGTTTPTYDVTGSHTYADAGVNGRQPGLTRSRSSSWTSAVPELTMTNTANVADNPITLTGQLNPASDSGVSTDTDDITNVTQPDFFGTLRAAFARHPVRDACFGGGTLAVDRPVQAGSDGSWNITSGVPWPTALPDHGHRGRPVRRDHHDRPSRRSRPTW